jgi:hypothetical protein
MAGIDPLQGALRCFIILRTEGIFCSSGSMAGSIPSRNS